MVKRKMWEWRDPKTKHQWTVEGSRAWRDDFRAPFDLPGLGQRSSDLPRGYKVTADDVVVAAGSVLGASVYSEAQLWYQAAKLAKAFNDFTKRSEKQINTMKDVYNFVNDQVKAGAVVPQKALYGGPPAETYPDRLPRRFDFNPQDDFVGGNGLYPGKRPPGVVPGRGAPSRARSGRIRILSSRFERA